jgi:hypothetical protein
VRAPIVAKKRGRSGRDPAPSTLGPDRVILRFAHPRATCGDSKGKLGCSGQCFTAEAA